MYSFEPSEEQKILMDSARKLANQEFRSRFREADERGAPAPEWTQTGWELGLLAASIPEEFGGVGEHSALTGVLAAEELAWGDLSATLTLTAPNILALPILLSGTAEQKRKLLPLFCKESYMPGSAALMEPRFDFNPNALKTTAVKKNGKYILSGTKCNVPFAAEARLLLAYASLDGKTEAFLLSPDNPGVILGKREQNMGMRAFPLYSLELQECEVNPSERLGGEAGCDFPQLLNRSRTALCAMALGVARAAYEYGLEYAKNRKAFGEAIAQRQSIAFMLAEMLTDLEAARMMVWEAAWLLDQKRDATRETYLAKSFTDDMVIMIADRAVQILGGHGYIRDYPVELWLRNARGFAVMEGIAIV